MFGEALVWYMKSLVAFWQSSPVSVIILVIIVSMMIRILSGRRRGWWGFGCCRWRCGCCRCHGSASCGPECSCHTEDDTE